MITQLKIERFKSIRTLSLSCRRINVLIGEPNTGKSNILEALGLLSWCGHGESNLRDFVRFVHTQNLFYDNLTDDPITIEWQGTQSGTLTIRLENDWFRVDHAAGRLLSLNFKGQANWHTPPLSTAAQVKFYRYRALESYESAQPGALRPPHGTNLFSVVYGSKAIREFIAELFRPFGLKATLRPHERAIELEKQAADLAISFPLSTASDTLQRMLFYLAAIESNQKAVLVFEEPEAHAFPYYTKHLGERIAADLSNQYFIATHNPYLLIAILEKAEKEDVNVLATQYHQHETKITALTEHQVSRLLDADPFLGLKGVLEAE